MKLRAGLPAFVELDELVAMGTPALIGCVEAYRPARGNLFRTFATPRLHGGILDALRSQDWVPRLARSRGRIRRAAAEAFQKEHGRPPSEEELAAALPAEFKSDHARILNEAPTPHIASLQAPATGQRPDDDYRLAHSLADPSAPSPLSAAQRADVKQYISRYLSREERLILILNYYERMTLAEIGVTLGISESRVSQKRTSILNRLRAQLTKDDAALLLCG